MPIQFLKDITDIQGEKVLLRTDFNVPLKDGVVDDDTRLLASLPTINFLREQGAKVIIVTHLGRPKGQVVEELRLNPVASRLSEIGNVEVKKLDSWIGAEVEQAVDGMQDGDVVMLENIRFSPDEKKDTGTLAQDLAALGDIFVLDGFAVAHRPAASVKGIAAHVSSYAGLLLEKEIAGLSKVVERPQAPLVAMIGGAKIETKLPVVENFLGKARNILLGGAVINNIYKELGYGIGGSRVDESVEKLEIADWKLGDVVMLPVDVVVGKVDGSGVRVVDVQAEPHALCGDDEAMYDIGPKTINIFNDILATANTIVLNGAMGYFEKEPYSVGTIETMKAAAARAQSSECYGVIGGGETVQVAEDLSVSDNFDLVSTGGGAMLEYLAGKELPGIAALT